MQNIAVQRKQNYFTLRCLVSDCLDDFYKRKLKNLENILFFCKTVPRYYL